jgi:hypothetical protein
MKLAKGHYICFNDADDISHKRRIEFQVKALQNNKNKVFSECLFFRKHKNNHLKINSKKYMLCIISMLFERQKVLNDLGGMANIILGEDSEFRERMVAFYGTGCEKIVYHPLYEASFSPNSSFFSKVKDLKIKGSSVTYEISEESNKELENYRKNWHKKIASEGASANINCKPKF